MRQHLALLKYRLYTCSEQTAKDICNINPELYVYALTFCRHTTDIIDFDTIPKHLQVSILSLVLFHSYTTFEKIIHKYDDIDLEQVFDSFLDYLIDHTNMFLFLEANEKITQCCSYMFSAKVDLNKYTHKILMCILKGKVRLEKINGLCLTNDQIMIYEQYTTYPKPYMEWIINKKWGKKSFALLYAINNYRYIPNNEIDETMLDAYETYDIIHINKHKHVPNKECIIRACKFYGIIVSNFEESSEGINTLYNKLNIHIFEPNDKLYNLDDVIKLSIVLQIILKTKSHTMTIREFYITYIKSHVSVYYVNKYNMNDILEYYYISHEGDIATYTNIYRSNVYVKLGDLLKYYLDSYL